MPYDAYAIDVIVSLRDVIDTRQMLPCRHYAMPAIPLLYASAIRQQRRR